MPKEALLVRTLVQLAESLVDDFDVVELLSMLTDRCVDVLDISAAGVMLAAPEGDLRVVASSGEAMRMVQLFELQSDEGPCVDAYRSGEAVLLDEDLAIAGGRWPRFAPVAVEAGFHSAHALPLRLRGSVIGALNLFSARAGALSPADVTAGQALADVATITVIQQRIAAESRVLIEQLNTALSSRVVIEQAKGVLAERAGLSMESAFEAMRGYARNRNMHLADVARGIIDRTVSPESLHEPPPAASLKPVPSAEGPGCCGVRDYTVTYIRP